MKDAASNPAMWTGASGQVNRAEAAGRWREQVRLRPLMACTKRKRPAFEVPAVRKLVTQCDGTSVGHARICRGSFIDRDRMNAPWKVTKR
jgi:hypothetical protein